MKLPVSNRLFFVLLAALLGVATFGFAFGPRALDPGDHSWLYMGDLTQHLMGWLHFQQAGWTFPLGGFDRYLYPLGSSLAYNDVFPGFAVAARLLLGGLLPVGGQITGLWLLACCVLQGVFGYLFVRALLDDTPDDAPPPGSPATAPPPHRPDALHADLIALSGSLVLLAAPIFLYRFDLGHASLCAQWLVLASLWRHVRERSTPPARSFAIWLALTTASASIHPYLATMVLAIASASALVRLQSRRRDLRHVLGTAAALLALATAAAATFWAFGMLSGGRWSDEGFFTYGADLLGLFNPGARSWLLAGPARDNGHEGYAWPGAGVALLWLVLGIAFVRRQGEVGALLRRIPHRALGLVTLALATFALGSHVHIWGLEVVRLTFVYDALDLLTGTFRAPGRFVWPLYYLVAGYGLLAASRMISDRRRLAVLLGLVALVQVVDQHPSLFGAERRMNPPPLDITLEAPAWHELGARYRTLAMVPPAIWSDGCQIAAGGAPEPYHSEDFLPFAQVAYARGMNFNSGPRARPPRQGYEALCERYLHGLERGELEADTVYVVHPAYLERMQRAWGDRARCAVLDGQHVCAQR